MIGQSIFLTLHKHQALRVLARVGQRRNKEIDCSFIIYLAILFSYESLFHKKLNTNDLQQQTNAFVYKNTQECMFLCFCASVNM